MSRLSACTYLGDNTVPILDSIVHRLNRHPALTRSGSTIGFDPEMASADRLAGLDGGRFDLIWACGLYTVSSLIRADRYRVVAVPTFAGETAPVYRSVIVARAGAAPASLEEAVAGEARLMANEPQSWSGYHGLIHELRRRGLAPDMAWHATFTGAHSNSVAAVADSTGGRPAIAAVDHTVWDHLVSSGDPSAARVVVIDRTADWPAPPFSLRSDLEPGLLDALVTVLLGVTADGVVAVTPATADDYAGMLG